jgi:hypothetical protein
LEVVGIVRAGEALERKSELLKHIGCIVGCMGAFTDNADAPQPFGEVVLPDDLESCCNEVEAVCSGEGYAINPAVVALLLKLVELVLNKYL